MKFRRDDVLTLGVVAVVLLADQLTKAWALRSFQSGPKHVIWTLELVVTHNSGTAFSLMSGKGIGPVVALLAVIVIAVVARTMRGVHGRVAAVAVGLVVGGALGNVADRAFRSHSGFLQGAVVDWIDFQWWPVFNIADSAIVVGAILLAIISVFATDDDDNAGTGSGDSGVPARGDVAATAGSDATEAES